MSKPHCPKCGSADCKTVETHGFQFSKNRECKTCGVIWKPACPKWAAKVCVGLGIGFAATFLVLLIISLILGIPDMYSSFKGTSEGIAPKPVQKLWHIFGFISLMVIFYGGLATLFAKAAQYGIRVLKGKTGSLQIVREGKPSTKP
jgi:hypothetical protein